MMRRRASDALGSVARFSWSMAMFGARRAGDTVAWLTGDATTGTTAASLDAVSKTTVANLSDPREELFHSLEKIQNSGLEAGFQLADPWLRLGKSMAAAGLRFGLGSARASSQILGPSFDDSQQRWRQLQNRLDAFELFCFAPAILDGELRDGDLGDGSLRKGGEGADLLARVAVARQQDSFRCLWLLEGLGYAHGEAAWQGDTLVEQRLALAADLAADPAADQNHADLLPLHTGMGLSLARRLLPALRAASPTASPEKRRQLLERLVLLCQRNSHQGFEIPTFEALGMIARQLAPGLVNDLHEDLQEALDNNQLVAALWHGVGRALYMVPSQLPLTSLSRALGKTRDSPNSLARANALAGLSWALCLVNLSHPEVLSAFIDGPFAAFDHDEQHASLHGITGALTLWAAHGSDSSGSDSSGLLPQLRDHRSDEPWQPIAEACEVAQQRQPVSDWAAVFCLTEATS